MEADRLSRFATRQHHGWAYCTSASVCAVWRKYWLIIYITLWPKVIAQNRPKERQLTNMMAAAELCELIFRKLDLGATHISPCLSSLKSISGCSKLGNLTIMSNSQTTVITQLHSPINEFPTNKRMALRLRSIRLFVSPFVDSKGWQLQTTYHRGHAKVVRQSAAPSTARRARLARAKRSKAYYPLYRYLPPAAAPRRRACPSASIVVQNGARERHGSSRVRVRNQLKLSKRTLSLSGKAWNLESVSRSGRPVLRMRASRRSR